MKNKLLIALPTVLLLVITLIIVPKISAQVVSGDISLLDIVMDSGGGSRESGTGADRVILKNTSIGQTFGGNFVTSGNTTVCAGHACKHDYEYAILKTPLLAELVVNAGDDAVAAGTYKFSGLRDDSEGQNYYNSLFVQPGFKAENPADIEVAGVAFIENRNDVRSFLELFKSADTAKGFVVIYVNENKNIPNIPKPAVKPSGCTTDFCKDHYYVYMNGSWQRPYLKSDATWKSSVQNGITIKNAAGKQNLPTKPAFNVLFGKDRGTATWGTYGFVLAKTSPVFAGNITLTEPQPTSTLDLQTTKSVPEIATFESTFYLFDIF